jgi:hypothetical protein
LEKWWMVTMGPDAGCHQRVEEGVVVRERLFVDHVTLGLDAGPVDAEAVAVDAELDEQAHVFDWPWCSRATRRPRDPRPCRAPPSASGAVHTAQSTAWF